MGARSELGEAELSEATSPRRDAVGGRGAGVEGSVEGSRQTLVLEGPAGLWEEIERKVISWDLRVPSPLVESDSLHRAARDNPILEATCGGFGDKSHRQMLPF